MVGDRDQALHVLVDHQDRLAGRLQRGEASPDLLAHQRAMRSGRCASMRSPRKRMTPLLAGVRPMIERTVVVFPMPLRPSSVATSPARIASSRPNSTWLAPYAVSRFSTCSNTLMPSHPPRDTLS